MQILKEKIDLNNFWQRLATAPQAQLLLDFDGTLAPFVADRNQACLYPQVGNELLALLHQDAAQVTIVSGRDVSDLLARLELKPPPELWGCHGWQRRFADGRLQTYPMPEAVRAALEKAQAIAVSTGTSQQLEVKPFSLALHWRGISVQERAALKHQVLEPWQQLTAEGELLMLPFDGGVELRCPGVTKGTVVKQILEESQQGSVIAYLGDDLTDEDAFVALDDKGLKVLVRSERRATAADLWLRPPEEVLWFLRKWRKTREGGAENE